MKKDHQPIYSILARIYDTLMEDVNYEYWADYIDDLIQIHAPGAEKLLELACGTGTVALSLEELGYYCVTATDASPEMIFKAKEKAARDGSDVQFKVMNFLDIHLEGTFDVVYLVFDSINYLHKEKEILALHEQVAKILNPGGLFIFDFTTPRNSRKAIHYLNNEEGLTPDNYRFFRTSRYDGLNNIHTNEFEIEKLASDRRTVEKTFVEVHKQKIYTLQQMQNLSRQSGYRIIGMYDDFTFEQANRKSLRVTMVCQQQT